MSSETTMRDDRPGREPDLSAFDAMVRRAYAALPSTFRDLTANVLLRVTEFPPRDALDELGIDSPFGLLGLFQGVGMAHDGAVPATGRMPNMVWLFRRPILAFAAAEHQRIEPVITHVLVHEIGHHFGFSDEDMEAIDAGER